MCCRPEADNGFLCNIRRIFTGKPKRRCHSPFRDKLYTYSISQLKCLEQDICYLEDEANCLECAVRDAFCCECSADCEYIGCSLKKICERLDCIKRDLECAEACYDPCRDHCEFDLICCLTDRVRCLDTLVYDLTLQVDCLLESQGDCYRGPCCDRRVTCEPGCRKPCCFSYKTSWDSCGSGDGCNPCETRGWNLCGPRGCCPYESDNECESYDCNLCGPCGTSRPCATLTSWTPYRDYTSCGPCRVSDPCNPCRTLTSYWPCKTSTPCGPCDPCGPSRPYRPCDSTCTSCPTPCFQPACGVACQQPCYRPSCDSPCKQDCCN